MTHWLLYTSDRECGGCKIEGVFESEGEAWDHYLETYNENERYWRIPSVEQWKNERKIES